MIIKRLNPMSVAKVQAFIAAAIMLLLAILFTLFKSILPFPMAPGMGGAGIIFLFVIMPILYGGFGFVAGFVAAYVYNFAADKVGGIEIETE